MRRVGISGADETTLSTGSLNAKVVTDGVLVYWTEYGGGKVNQIPVVEGAFPILPQDNVNHLTVIFPNLPVVSHLDHRVVVADAPSG